MSNPKAAKKILSFVLEAVVAVGLLPIGPFAPRVARAAADHPVSGDMSLFAWGRRKQWRYAKN